MKYRKLLIAFLVFFSALSFTGCNAQNSIKKDLESEGYTLVEATEESIEMLKTIDTKYAKLKTKFSINNSGGTQVGSILVFSSNKAAQDYDDQYAGGTSIYRIEVLKNTVISSRDDSIFEILFNVSYDE